jgi:hypothetical protein
MIEANIRGDLTAGDVQLASSMFQMLRAHLFRWHRLTRPPDAEQPSNEDQLADMVCVVVGYE